MFAEHHENKLKGKKYIKLQHGLDKNILQLSKKKMNTPTEERERTWTMFLLMQNK